jgi:hypothetical protein
MRLVFNKGRKKMMVTKIAAGLAACLMSCSAFAVTKNITVTANVDTALEMSQPDGSALPDSLEMVYRPGQGLVRLEQMTKIFTNDDTKNLEIRLVNTPELIENSGAMPIKVPLTVKYMDKPLSSTPTTLDASEVYAAGVTGESVQIPLHIEQTRSAELVKSGVYRGLVTLALVHAAAGP